MGKPWADFSSGRLHQDFHRDRFLALLGSNQRLGIHTLPEHQWTSLLVLKCTRSNEHDHLLYQVLQSSLLMRVWTMPSSMIPQQLGACLYLPRFCLQVLTSNTASLHSTYG